MSGDVQPRKRKDKKKRRDDSDAKAADLFARKMSVRDDDESKEKSPSGVHVTKMGPDDIQLHVHSDHGTGGHWCAKILFFSLMAVLVGLIGLILLENRGISDLDTPLSESRFADYLEGWVDEKRDSHDEHDVLESLHELDDHDHDNEPFAEDDHDDEDDENDDENDDHDDENDDDEDDGHEDHGDEENDHDNQDDDNNDQQDDQDDDEEGDNNDGTNDADDNQDDEDENEHSVEANPINDEDDDSRDDNDDEDELDYRRVQEDDNDNDDDRPNSHEEEKSQYHDDNDDEHDNQDEHDNDGYDNKDDTFDNDDDDDDDVDTDIKSKNKDKDDDDKDEGFEDQLNDDIKDDDDDDNSPYEEHVDNFDLKLTEGAKKTYISSEDLEIQVNELYENFNKLAESLNVPKIVPVEDHGNLRLRKEDDDDDDDASHEEFIDNDKGEDLHLQKLTQKEGADDDGEQPEESSSLTVKLAVGLALVVVAHFVLVKRSKSNEEELIESSPIESSDLKRRLTLITPSETIPSDVDDEQPNEDEDDDYEEDELKDGYEDDVHEDDIDVEGDNEIEEVEYSEDDEEEDDGEIKDLESVEKVADKVDTYTEMKNQYRPKIDTQPVNIEEKIEIKANVKNIDKDNIQVHDDEDDYEEDEDDELEGSENSEEDVDDEEEEEELSDVDDGDLMKRLESKYGKLPDSNPSDEEEIEEKWTKVKRSGPQYDDYEDELRRTNELLDDNPTSALKSFEFLIKIKPNSSKAWYGKGRALDMLSEEQKSNELLKEAIDAYFKAVEFGSLLDDETFRNYADRCIDRMRFIGQHLKAVPVHEALIKRFNDDPYFRNQLAVTYLLKNRLSDAKLVLHETLLRWRHDGFALVHYGFVLKNLDKNHEAAAVFLQEGIDTNAEGTNDGRFYFNLGEALTRLGRNKEAMAIYRKGATKKLFLSEYQRSLYNVDRLESRPFWTKKESGYKRYFEILEQNWERIRDEGLSVLNSKGHFTDESENLRDIGDWKQFDLFARGRKVVKHCEKTPFTCKVIETFPAARFCNRGQVKFSVMHPGTHVWPHCGPTNCRIRAHLGLKVPEKTFIRVATETRSWKEGEILIFDDSFEHEVWHNGTSVRLVLIVDVWHPDLTEEERTTLYPI